MTSTRECSIKVQGAVADRSIFGRAIGGLDIIHEIENVKVDKNDKPWEEIKIMSVTVE